MKKIVISKDNFSKTGDGIFEGWGTSLCWWAHRVGFSEKLTEDSARLFFSREGLGLNIMRYNIGGGDDPTHNHIKRTDSEIPGWLYFDGEGESYYDVTADEKQLRVLSAAYKAAGDEAYVEAFSNSPPYFMTVSGCSSGNKRASSTNIRMDCVEDFAEYLATVTEYLESSLGIRVKSLACMNEPYTNYWKAYSEKQEGCHVSPGEKQSRMLLATAKALKAKGLEGVLVTASDETNTILATKSAGKYSDEAWGVIGRLSTHTYAKATKKIGEIARKRGLKLWQSETDWSSIDGKNAGEMGPALWLAGKIIEDMNTLSPNAWVTWQIVAAYISQYPDEKGRRDMPGIPPLDKGFWGCAFADIDKEEIYLTQKYYAFGQFSRYIRPGMKIIHTGKDSIAACGEDSLVLVCLNSEGKDKDISVDFSDLGDYASCRMIRTGGSLAEGEHWADCGGIPVDASSFTATLKGNSVTTFLLHR